ncbi:MAG: 3-dehydroquinate dehydratase [Bacteroidales bacterium]|jgi:3-dehydroquinate dehydratase-2|nr:3-dehydroquinate dehydratase [Bacteroidales bacterium]
MKRITIINGANLNFLGKREKDIYGNENFETFFKKLEEKYPKIELNFFQSNIEGEIINFLQKEGEVSDGIILNAGGYSHTSVSILDAIKSIKSPVIEVHISNIFAREDFRHTSLISSGCKGVILGFGLKSYILAIEAFLN